MAAKVIWQFTKTSAKLGVAGGTVYYTASNGLWGSAEESAAFLRQQLAKSKISPATIDKLGEKMTIWSDPNHVPLSEKWNRTVTSSIQFMLSLPSYVEKLKFGKAKEKQN